MDRASGGIEWDRIIMSTDPKEQLLSASLAIQTAIALIKSELPTIETFLKEARDMENYGHVLNPTLYRDSTRRAVNAVMEPLFKSAALFVAEYDEHVERSKVALEVVTGRDGAGP